jgi:phage terminase Nu1 subunit (DNA packaging protein)
MDKEPEKKHGIMNTPLPLLLDDIESATEEAKKAAEDAKKAAEEARLAGEKAAQEVMKRFRKVFLKMAKDIQDALDETV